MATRPRRASTETQRLYRGDGKKLVFWEITRAGASLTTRFGRYQSEGRRTHKEFAGEQESKLAFAKMIAGKRKEGYGNAPQRLAPGDASEKGVCARNAELEALIDQAPNDPHGYLVYADWLQQRRDVRGELIVVQHGLSMNSDDRALERVEAALFGRFAAELVGPLADCTYANGRSWRYGFLRAARIRQTSTVAAAVQTLLGHPSARFLERLVLDDHRYGRDCQSDLENVFALLAAATPTLDSLLIGESFGTKINIGPLWKVRPGLRWLVLASTVTSPRLGEVRPEALEELVVTDADDDLLSSIASAHWPKLRRLSVGVIVPSESREGPLAGVYASRGLPSLAHLTVRRWVAGASAALIPDDALALQTLRFAASRRLARVDIHIPLSDEGAQAMLDEPSLSDIGEITIWKQGVRGMPLRAHLAKRLSNLTWTDSVEPSLGDLTAYDAET